MDTKTKMYLQRAITIHNGKYDYSNVNTWNQYEQLAEIMCPKHGPFYQTVRTHIQKRCGCPKCGKETLHNSRRSTLSQFLHSARQIHGDKYDYSKVEEYDNNHTKVEIICPIHGSWFQSPAKHINVVKPCGCPKCVGKNMTTKDFVERARVVHGGVYDYNDTVYQKSNKKVSIRCALHGAFAQTPNNHLMGYGCKKCAEEANPGVYSDLYFRINKHIGKMPGILYLLRFSAPNESSFLKIGITKHLNVKKRFPSVYAGYQVTPIITAKCCLKQAFDLEQHLHNTLNNLSYNSATRLIGKGHTECFIDCTSVVDEYISVVEHNNLMKCIF